MQDQAESGAGIRERRAEHGHVVLVGQLDQGILLARSTFREIAAHFADEFPRGIGARLQPVGDFADGVVAGLEFFLIDVGVVDAVDVLRAQVVVVDIRRALVVAEAQGLEEVHVDDAGPGRDDGVHHVVADQVGIDLHAAAGRGRTGERQEDRAVLVGQHVVVDAGRPRQIARGERHFRHAVDDRPGVDLGDVDMFDGLAQQGRFFIGHLLFGGLHFICSSSTAPEIPGTVSFCAAMRSP